jgi:YgiT-type zinc finger domain-containing protein
MKINLKEVKRRNYMGFWNGERCEYCNNVIVEKTVDLPRKIGDRYILIKNVPAGVCKKCGTRYYAANVLKSIESIVYGRRKAEDEIPMAVYSL